MAEDMRLRQKLVKNPMDANGAHLALFDLLMGRGLEGINLHTIWQTGVLAGTKALYPARTSRVDAVPALESIRRTLVKVDIEFIRHAFVLCPDSFEVSGVFTLFPKKRNPPCNVNVPI